MSGPIWRQSIQDQAAAVGRGEITAQQLAADVRAAIDAAEPDLRAWTELADEFPSTVGADTRPLAGVSVAVKDLIDVAGLPTRCGSAVTSAAPATADAACVTRLRELGAVIQGKTVTTEFGYFAPGPTRNPRALTHTPGGSSSGSAAAVGAGVVPLALGTQTAGSTTRPASFCGAAAMVLAHGAASLDGVAGLCESLDSLGLLTRTIADLATAYEAFSGDTRPESFAPVGEVHIWEGSGLGEFHPAMTELVARLDALVLEAGADLGDLDGDDHVRTLTEDHFTVMAYEAFGVLDPLVAQHRDRLSTQLVDLAESGRRTSADDYEAAIIRRDTSFALLRSHLSGTAGSGSVIIAGPAALGPAPEGLAATGDPILSRPWQLLGCPVVVVPGARTEAGLPLGVQLIGLPGQEWQLLEFAARLEPLLGALDPITGTSVVR
ncbi:amidase [Gordonia phthalatica]|uniref:Indole acetimide hydrolase n=1 Tax=Gordonia phthalatica TaxID=1136941 RepID=A0A0N9NEC1_9ACTN|nr:indole acetimide hydrolase [Gordonia phthalatica]